MYVAPQLTDLGSFQELTLSTSIQAASGGIIGPIGSLIDSTVGLIKHEVGSLGGTGIDVDDNSHYHAGTTGADVHPDVTITVR